MNQRIKLLAEQAAATKKYVPPVWQFYDDELEKFAESIVQECAKLADTDSSYPHKDFGDKIKAHFGIKP